MLISKTLGGDMATNRNVSGARKPRQRAGEVGRMLGELEGRARRKDARGRLWTEAQPPNVKTGKACA
jgi:hypothetical protein